MHAFKKQNSRGRKAAGIRSPGKRRDAKLRRPLHASQSTRSWLQRSLRTQLQLILLTYLIFVLYGLYDDRMNRRFYTVPGCCGAVPYCVTSQR